MRCRTRDWQQLFQLARSEKDHLKKNALCELARLLIHDRSLELAEAKMHHQVDSTAENNALDQASRSLGFTEPAIATLRFQAPAIAPSQLAPLKFR